MRPAGPRRVLLPKMASRFPLSDGGGRCAYTQNMQARVLLVSLGATPEGLKRELERLKVHVVPCAFSDTEEMCVGEGPDLIVLCGTRGAIELAMILDDQAVECRVRMVIVSERKELAKLRGLNRDIVISLLALETSDHVVGQRIESLARRAARRRPQESPSLGDVEKKTSLGLPSGQVAVAKIQLAKGRVAASPPSPAKTAALGATSSEKKGLDGAAAMDSPKSGQKDLDPAAPGELDTSNALSALEDLDSQKFEITPAVVAAAQASIAAQDFAETPLPPAETEASESGERPAETEPPEPEEPPEPGEAPDSGELKVGKKKDPNDSVEVQDVEKSAAVDHGGEKRANRERIALPAERAVEPSPETLTFGMPQEHFSEGVSLDAGESSPKPPPLGSSEAVPARQDDEPQEDSSADASFSDVSELTVNALPDLSEVSASNGALAEKKRGGRRLLFVVAALAAGAAGYLSQNMGWVNEAGYGEGSQGDTQKPAVRPTSVVAATPPEGPAQTEADAALAEPLSAREVANLPVPSKPEKQKNVFWVADVHAPGCREVVAELSPSDSRDPVHEASLLWAQARKLIVGGKDQGAQLLMCQAALLNPSSLAVEGLAQHYLRVGSLARSLTWADKALQIRPGQIEILNLRGDLFNLMGEVEKSRQIWLEVLHVSPDQEARIASISKDYSVEAGRHLRRGDLHRAERWYRRSITLDPENLAGMMGLAKVYARLEKPASARAFCEMSLRLSDVIPEVHVLLGELALAEGNSAEAKKRFERALKVRPGFYPAKRGLRASSQQ